MCAWISRAMTPISRVKRSIATEFASSRRRILSATGRSTRRSCARYTEAMPPRPNMRSTM